MKAVRVVLAVTAGALSLLGGLVLTSGNATRKDLSASIQSSYESLVTMCNTGETEFCLQLPIARMAMEYRYDEAIKALTEHRESSPEFQTRCHDVSHLIGKIAYHDLGPATTIDDLPGGCQGGIYHGALEEWGSENSVEDMAKVAPRLCDPLSADEITREICLHGIGHAVERSTRDWGFASGFCIDVMDAADVTGCVSGAISSGLMYEQAEIRGRYTLNDIDALMESCAELGEENENCVMMVGYYSLHLAVNFKFDEALEYCTTRGDLFDECSRGVGMTIASSKPEDPMRSLYWCSSGRTDQVDGCLAGAAMWVVQNLDDADTARTLIQSNPNGPGPHSTAVLSMIDGLISAHARARGEVPSTPIPAPVVGT